MTVMRSAAFCGFILAAGIAFQPASPPSAMRLVLDGTVNVGVGGWGALGGLAISPDGRQIAYIANDSSRAASPRNGGAQSIWLKTVGGGAATRLAMEDPPGGITDLAFSPDGRSLAFDSARGLRRVRITGGASTVICAACGTYTGLTWGDDDRIVFTAGSRVMRVSATGGEPETISIVPSSVRAGNAQVLPGTDAVLFTFSGTFGPPPQIVVQRGTTFRVVIADRGHAAQYVPATGEILYDLDGALFAVPFNLRELHTAGPPVKIMEDVTETGDSQSRCYAVSENGTLVFATGHHGWREAAIVARDGTRKSAGRVTGTTAAVRVSPDGTRMAFDGEGQVWVETIGVPASMRALTTGDSNHGPVWTPDGQRIAFSRFDRDPDWRDSVYVQRADGSGGAEMLIHNARRAESWSETAGRLSFLRRNGNLTSLWTFNPKDGTSRLLRYLKWWNAASAFSPDGKWLAYEDGVIDAAHAGEGGLFVESPSKPGRRIRLSKTGSHPAWSPDGRELFFDAGGTLSVVWVDDRGGAPTFGDPHTLPIAAFLQRGGAIGFESGERAYDVMPDGKSFLMMFPTTVEVAVIPNWTTQRRQ